MPKADVTLSLFVLKAAGWQAISFPHYPLNTYPPESLPVFGILSFSILPVRPFDA